MTDDGTPASERLGQRVRRLREERGWAQAACARELGMTKQQLSNLEHSEQQRSLHTETLRHLARVLEVSETYLLTGVEAVAAPVPSTLPAVLRGTSHLSEEQIVQVMAIVRELEAKQEAFRLQRDEEEVQMRNDESE